MEEKSRQRKTSLRRRLSNGNGKPRPADGARGDPAEDALRESEARLELFFSQSLDGFFFMMIDEPVRWDDTVDKEQVLDYVFSHQRITKVNDAMLAQYGATAEQFLGLTPNDFHQHNLVTGREGWRRFLDAGRLHVETDERKLDGTPMWIEGDYICLYDAEGRLTGHFGIQREVTERKRAEVALRQYNQRLKTLQEIDRAILAAHSPAQIAQAAMHHIHDLVPCMRASVAVFDFAAGKAVLIAIHTNKKTKLDVGTELTLEAFGDVRQLWQGKVHVVEDTETFSSPSEVVASVRTEGVRAYINVPLLAQGELIGVLNLGSEHPGRFSSEQIEITQEVADSLAIAIRQARLFEQLGQHLVELEQRVEERTAELSAANASLKNEIAERERIEAVLRENEERYRSLYNNTPVMLHSSDGEKNVVSVNDFWLRTLGYERDEVIGRPVTDFLTEASRRFVVEVAFPRLFQAGSVKDVEVQFVKKSGEVIDVLVSALLKRDAQGQVLWTQAFLLDVTERKKAEQALRESEQRFRRLVEHAADAFLVVDGQGRFVDVNQRACESLGYSREELLDMSVADVQMEVSLDEIQDIWKKMVPGVPITMEGVHRRKDGSVFPVEVRVGLIELEGRQCAFALARDVTERKRIEQVLREREEWYRDFYDEAPIAYFSIGTDGRILQANKRAAELTGCPIPELLGRSAFDFFPDTPSGRPKQQKLFPKFLSGEGFRSEELEVRRADGKQVWISLSSVAIRDAQGNVIADRSTAEDITALKHLEEALQRYSENLQELVDERTIQLRQSEERKRVLLEINNAIISYLDRESLFDAIAKTLRSVLSFDRISVSIYDPVTDLLKVLAVSGIAAQDAALSAGIKVPRQGSLLGRAVDQQRPVIGRDLREGLPESVDANIVAALMAAGIRSYLTLPLIAREKVVGVLNLTSLTPGQYSERDAEIMQEIAKQIALAVENMEAYEEIAQLKARLEQENVYLQEEIRTEHSFEEIIGRCQPIRKILQAVETVAPTDATVLILGETGTGKELIARAIHNLSPRKESVLVKVNCAALPAGLIESELFGHEKGAFTGAIGRKIGRFEMANGGTIFLDEIGDLPLELQAKLLRALQEGEFERVGSSETLRVEVRVIAATNRDLEKAVQENRFRSDLFYRLNVFPLRLPPLHERKDDIPFLVRHFVMKHNARLGKKIEAIPPKIMEALQSYSWPGNVRELENIIERAVIITQGTRLDLGDWPPKSAVKLSASRTLTLQGLEREHILSVLKSTGWRVSGEGGAAKVLGMKPTTLEARMKKLGIKRMK